LIKAPVTYPYIIIDGDICLDEAPLNSTPEGMVVYEVVRLIEGKPLFWDEHYHRLMESCSIAHLNFSLSSTALIAALKKLVTSNGVSFINFKLEVFSVASQLHYRMFFIASNYPDKLLYTTGVPLGFLNEERIDPSAKIINVSIRNKANRLIEQENFFEVLLVNAKGEITEGSRSNVFFIAGTRLLTPPLHEVLPGVTRFHVIQIAQQMGFSVDEVVIKAADISSFDSAFITGTSPMLMPVSSINNHAFNTQHPVCKTLLDGYQQKVIENINSFEY